MQSDLPCPADPRAGCEVIAPMLDAGLTVLW